MKNTLPLSVLLTGVAFSLWGPGCASTPPKELVEARANYERVSKGSAAEATPTSVYNAKKTLDVANRSFEKDGNSNYTRDVAYIALRKTQLAEVQANIELAQREKSQLEKEAQLRAQSELTNTRQQLETEKQARQEAMDRLAKLASVREEKRGIVVTLSGGVLFAFGKSTLLSSAQVKLDEVADALKKTEAENFVVEGHTDSIGSAGFNHELSLRRARTVRDYLVDKGVPAERIQATGYGKRRPVADNKTPEGRANNRRVEIVVRHTDPNKG